MKSPVVPKASQATTEAARAGGDARVPPRVERYGLLRPRDHVAVGVDARHADPLRVAEAHPAHQEALPVPGHRVVDGVLRRDLEVAGAERRPVGVEHAALDREDRAVVLPPRDQVVTAAEGDVGEELQLPVLAEIDPVEGEQGAGRVCAHRADALEVLEDDQEVAAVGGDVRIEAARGGREHGAVRPEIGAHHRIEHRREAAGVNGVGGDAQLDPPAGPARRHRRTPAVGVDPCAVPVEEARAVRARDVQPARVARDRSRRLAGQTGPNRNDQVASARGPLRELEGDLACVGAVRPALAAGAEVAHGGAAAAGLGEHAPLARNAGEACAPDGHRLQLEGRRGFGAKRVELLAKCARTRCCIRRGRQQGRACGARQRLAMERPRGDADADDAAANLERVPEPARREAVRARAKAILRRNGQPAQLEGRADAQPLGPCRPHLRRARLTAVRPRPTTRARRDNHHKPSPQYVRPHDDLLPTH